jgi:hypothetical protein
MRLHAQFVVRGSVRDDQAAGFPGVIVMEQRSGFKTSTDENGNFNLTCSEKNPLLEFLFVGFMKQQIQVDSIGIVSVLMFPEITAIPYGFSGKISCPSAPPRWTSVGLSGGLRYTPLGIKITNYTPYFFGVHPNLRSSLEWRTNNFSNRCFSFALKRDQVFWLQNHQIGFEAEFKRLRIKTDEISELNLVSSTLLWRMRLSAGYTRQLFSQNEIHDAGHGLNFGISSTILKRYSINLKSKFVRNLFQYDFKISRDIPVHWSYITLSAGYERIGIFDEVSASIQYQFDY